MGPTPPAGKPAAASPPPGTTGSSSHHHPRLPEAAGAQPVAGYSQPMRLTRSEACDLLALTNRAGAAFQFDPADMAVLLIAASSCGARNRETQEGAILMARHSYPARARIPAWLFIRSALSTVASACGAQCWSTTGTCGRDRELIGRLFFVPHPCRG
jgi:hypothetical protein